MFPRPLALALTALFVLSAPAHAIVDVWIDPGHGGTDPGNLGFSGNASGYEKVLNLAVGNALYNRLGQIGYCALMTRNGDSNPTKILRADMASGRATNDLGETDSSQLFVSVHMNSGVASVFGTETYYSPYKKFSPSVTSYRTDSSFARTIHTDLMTGAAAAFLGCNNNRGIKSNDHTVTKRSRVPAILVEVCFSTNQCQQTNIVQAGDQALIANGIASGVSKVIPPVCLSPGASGTAPAPPNAAVASMEVAIADAPESGFLDPVVAPASASRISSYAEGFESATFPPTGWTLTTLGLPAPHRWARRTEGPFVRSGVGAAAVGALAPGALDEWLISPELALGTSDRGLRFYWKGNRNFPNVSAQCLVKPVGSGSWTSVWSLAAEPEGTEFSYRERVVDLTPWIGSSIQFAFRCAGPSSGADVAIDDVAVGDFGATATPANDLCANATPLSVGSFAFAGSTCYAANHMDPFEPTGSCVADQASGADVFYRVEALASDTLIVTATGSWNPVVYLVNSCDDVTATCLAASSTLQDATLDDATFLHIFAAAGTYYLVVDGLGGDCGDFQLSGTFRGAVTGVPGPRSDLQDEGRLDVWPNPSRGVVRLAGTLPGRDSQLGILRVFDLAGREVWSQPVQVASGRFELSWEGRDASGARLPSGAYLALIEIRGVRAVARTIRVD